MCSFFMVLPSVDATLMELRNQGNRENPDEKVDAEKMALLQQAAILLQHALLHTAGQYRRRRAGLDAEFDEDVFQMLVDGAWTHAEDLGDVAIGFALAQPHQHIALARRQ